jgi:hypothetical protein
MSSIKELIAQWSSLKDATDPYSAAEELANGGSTSLWKYAVIYDQIESAWSNDECRGALALNLARNYVPASDALAAFIALSGKWPIENATTALNLLALAHRSHPLPKGRLGDFLAYASANCILEGLRDQRELISEEAVNVLGGMNPEQLRAVSTDTLARLKSLALDVLTRIDDVELVTMLRGRIDVVFADSSDAVDRNVPSDSDVRILLRELEPFWNHVCPETGERDVAATLRTHAAGLLWRAASTDRKPVEVVYVYPDDAGNGRDAEGWNVIQPWFDTVQDLLREGGKLGPKVQFEPLDAMNGSLMITLRLDARKDVEAKIVSKLKEAAANPAEDEDDAFGDIYDIVQGRSLHVRVAHVQPDGSSASVLIAPGADEPGSLHRSKKLRTTEIPQANSPEKIFAVVDCVARDVALTPSEIDVTSERQVQYYRAAARSLSLLSVPTERLTRTGWLLNVASGDDKFRRLRAAFEASPCGQAWLEWAQVTKLGDIPPDSGEAFLMARSELTGDTVSRRASTINRWLKKLRDF